jgi:hypothetical protein
MRTQPRRGRVVWATVRRAIALLVVAVGTVAFGGQARAGTLDFAPYQQYDLTAGVQGVGGGWVAIGDVTGDGRADLLGTAFGHLDVFPQTSKHALGGVRAYSVPGDLDLGEIALGDFTRDQRTDVAVGTLGGVAVFAQRSDHTLSAPQIVPGTSGTFEVVTADMNRDGRPDLVIASDYGLKVLLNTKTGFASRLVAQPTFEKLSVADASGDGRPDIVAARESDELPRIFTQKSDGSYTAQRYMRFAYGDLLAADLGGRTALLSSSRDNRPNSVVTVSGLSKAGVAFPLAYGTYDSPDKLAVADMNRDGRRDIVVAHSGWDTAGVLLQNGDHSFARERVFLASFGGDQFTHVAVGDLDGDGWPEIALMDYDGIVTLLRHGTGDAYEVGAQTTITGGPTGVLPASQTTATFTFRSNGTHPFYQCSVDRHDEGPCTSPATFRNLAPGPHTFFVRTSDADQGAEQFWEARSWSIGDPQMVRPEPPLSPTPPDTTITSSPPSVSDSRDPAFTFTSSTSGVAFECTLDKDPLANSSWDQCRSGVQAIGLWGGEHTFYVRAVDSTGHADPTPASYTWTINGPHPDDPPPNDDFTNATPLIDGGNASGLTTQYATKEPEEPDHAGQPGGHSVWFTWTAPLTATYAIDTEDSDFDSLLAVYTGSSLSSLDLVAANDDVGSTDTTSLVDFRAVAGTTYDIAIDAKGAGGMGMFRIQELEVPWSNDDFADARVLTGASGSVTGDTTAATLEPGEPTIVGNPGGRSVWYAWTAPASGREVFDAHGSAFDSTIAVYTGTALDSLAKVAENDDAAPGDTASTVAFDVVAGTTYRVQVDGWNGTDHPPWYGPLHLSWHAG